jgi:hypothetical protein
MHKMVKSFVDDSNFRMLEEGKNCYIFLDTRIDTLIKITPINDDKITLEFIKQ